MGKPLLSAICLASILLTSCRWDIERVPHREDEGIHRNDDDSPAIPPADTTIYTFGLEFPTSYDWRRDSAYGNVACRVVLFADQKRIVEFDAGPGTGISADPDRHRIWDGHLYSDGNTGDCTVIYRDGEEIFRYPGREMICGFMVLDGRVHTLGQSRGGKGLSYRIDGECMLADAGGQVVGDWYSRPAPSGTMYLDGDCVCFGYRGSDGCWYSVRDAVAERVAADGLDAILDMRFVDGELALCGTAERYGGRAVLVHKGRAQQLWNREALATGYCHILPSGGELFVVEGHVRSDGRTETSLWQGGLTRNYGTDIAGFLVSGGSYATVTRMGTGRLGTVRSKEGFWWFRDEMLLMSPACAAYGKGAVLIAATPVRRELSPVLWKNGKSLALTINGYLAGISFAQSLE